MPQTAFIDTTVEGFSVITVSDTSALTSGGSTVEDEPRRDPSYREATICLM